jgi:hypothetical protein
MIASEPLHHFVDDYLSFLYETNPSAATFDGVHLHDDLLESFDRGRRSRWRGWRGAWPRSAPTR